jgi:hypothetical protein
VEQLLRVLADGGVPGQEDEGERRRVVVDREANPAVPEDGPALDRLPVGREDDDIPAVGVGVQVDPHRRRVR